MTSARIASSSAPSVSICSRLRWAIGLSSVCCRFSSLTMVMSRLSVVDDARAGGGADAGLDLDAVALAGVGDDEVAVAQVAHGTLLEREDAAEADAHAAAA